MRVFTADLLSKKMSVLLRRLLHSLSAQRALGAEVARILKLPRAGNEWGEWIAASVSPDNEGVFFQGVYTGLQVLE